MANNPNWTQDELLLALDLYLRFRERGSWFSSRSKEVRELSEKLQRLSTVASQYGMSFRSPSSVNLKLGNFLALDPNYKGVGLPNVAKADKEIWSGFGDRPNQVHKIARAIDGIIGAWPAGILGTPAAAVPSRVPAPLGDFRERPKPLPGTPLGTADAPPVWEDVFTAEAPEGRLLTRMHLVRERSRDLVRQKKAQARSRAGALACAACEFQYKNRYGEHGSDFIEVHHLSPLHTLPEEHATDLKDLALLCANCHRMVHHKHHHLLSVAEVRALLQ